MDIRKITLHRSCKPFSIQRSSISTIINPCKSHFIARMIQTNISIPDSFIQSTNTKAALAVTNASAGNTFTNSIIQISINQQHTIQQRITLSSFAFIQFFQTRRSYHVINILLLHIKCIYKPGVSKISINSYHIPIVSFK